MHAGRIGANAVKRKGVMPQGESRWGEATNVRGTVFHRIDFATDLAEKVMMVGPFAFIMRGSARNFDHFHRIHLHQNAQGAINRGNTQSRRNGGSSLPNFIRCERTSGIM